MFVMVEVDAFPLALRVLGVLERRELGSKVLGEIVRTMDWHGRVTLTRKQLAEQFGTSESNVSYVIARLVDARLLLYVPGSARTELEVNPRFATHLKDDARKEAQAASPELRMIERKVRQGVRSLKDLIHAAA